MCLKTIAYVLHLLWIEASAFLLLKDIHSFLLKVDIEIRLRLEAAGVKASVKTAT